VFQNGDFVLVVYLNVFCDFYAKDHVIWEAKGAFDKILLFVSAERINLYSL